ncbi:hypothetical protein LWI29_030014 [Acer saccharum]|uniref:Uncharacterized protein n=1 Tax=Acer saccharum TaxID=4024 RepID=A0AA39RNS4_ACESA|nr:hypothetical protein LWI29_030014 [Acer saccharum]
MGELVCGRAGTGVIAAMGDCEGDEVIAAARDSWNSCLRRISCIARGDPSNCILAPVFHSKELLGVDAVGVLRLVTAWVTPAILSRELLGVDVVRVLRLSTALLAPTILSRGFAGLYYGCVTATSNRIACPH